MCHIITGIIWPWYLAIVMNIIQNLRPRPIFWQATKIKKSVGLNTKNCIANYCKNATRCRIATYQNLIGSACCAQKNPPCNAIAGWPPNILRKKYQTLKLCICKEHKCRPQREWLIPSPTRMAWDYGAFVCCVSRAPRHTTTHSRTSNQMIAWLKSNTTFHQNKNTRHAGVFILVGVAGL